MGQASRFRSFHRSRRPWAGLAALALVVACRSPSPERHVGASAETVVAKAAGRDWPVYLGDPYSSQYSRLDQIDRGNVGRLTVAWTYHSGDADPEDRSQVQCNPLVIDGVVYGTTPGMKLFALDGATGEERWIFDPFDDGYELFGAGVNRGLVAHGAGEGLRLFYGAGDRLWAIRARDGRPDPGFGDGGSLDLHLGLGEPAREMFVAANSPGVVFEDLLVLGHRASERLPSAPGTVRAFDVETGALRWTFETIPQPGRPGSETWPEGAAERFGGANSWAGMSLDPERGLVFVPTGSAAFDFYGGDRPGQNRYANSLLALNARTGDLVWHFQFVHHDIWDRDLPAPPNLLTVVHDGRRIDAVAQITKSAHVFLFDRDTGTPLFPVEEVAVPASGLAGEQAWPTQPLPSRPPPFGRQQVRAEDLNTSSPEVLAWARQRFRFLRSGPQFVPPSLEGTIIYPGLDGGGEWGGAAVDPATGVMVVNASEMPWILRLVELQQGEVRTTADRGRFLYAVHCLSCHGVDREGDEELGLPSLAGLAERRPESWVRRLLRLGKGAMPAFAFLDDEQTGHLLDFLYGRGAPLPEPPDGGDAAAHEERYVFAGYTRFAHPDGMAAVEAPWGTLTAIDLNRGEILWQVPHGHRDDVDPAYLERLGLARSGNENYGGPILTAGGLVFVAGTRDERFWAYDSASGELLWQAELPAGGYATPATYEVGGRQYVLIAAGGGKMGTPSADAWVAFALPAEP